MSSSCPPDAIKSCPDGTIEVGCNVRINHIAPTIGANGSKTWESRTIDHMDPLSKGGTHSASNLCACCSSCNNKKGARGFMQFVAGLSDKHKRRAVAYYERLNKFVQQGSLSFGMVA